MTATPVPSPVLVVGAGLLGASVGLALTAEGVRVILRDISPATLHLARDLGAGELEGDDDGVRLVVVATPPDVAVGEVLRALREHPNAYVTDVASVKGRVQRWICDEAGEDAARYVGSHPMAGRERSGPAAADADLFQGRTWVICAHETTDAEAVRAVRDLALAVGALPRVMDADVHDAAVAAVSHLPQLMASVTAAQLTDVPDDQLSLAGQGIRDVTRIAASDPMMWSAIFAGNAEAILPHVEAAAASLQDVAEALRSASEGGGGARGVMGVLAGAVEDGRVGVARIPGKHGGAARRYAKITVFVPDKPGELGRLFNEVGEAGINIEDVQLEHAAGAKLGLATIAVLPARAAEFVSHLESRGWRVME